jgi:hypothetical protein
MRNDVANRKVNVVNIKTIEPGIVDGEFTIGFNCEIRLTRHDEGFSGPMVSIDGAVALSHDCSIRECEDEILKYAIAVLHRVSTIDHAQMRKHLDDRRASNPAHGEED